MKPMRVVKTQAAAWPRLPQGATAGIPAPVFEHLSSCAVVGFEEQMGMVLRRCLCMRGTTAAAGVPVAS